MVIIDTSIMIDHLRTLGKKESYLDHAAKNNPKEIFAVSVVTVQELYVGKSTRHGKEEAEILAVLGQFRVLVYSYEIAKKAGKLARDSVRPLEFADAAIAATAILNNASLLTLNKKDFEGIPDLALV